MINLNKEYKASQTGIITAIEPLDSWGLAEFTVNYRNNIYKGFIKNIPNFKRFRLGDKVKCGMTFFVVSDTFRITRMRKVNK